MPRTRQQTQSQPPEEPGPAAEVVDLTDPTPARTSPGKRKREGDTLEGSSSTKRIAPTTAADTVQRDLPATSTAAAPPAAPPAASPTEEPGHTPIGAMSCIICMESYTNATVAHCGHIFCHECLSRALVASEANNSRAHGNCPSCRKAISRKRGKQIIPISFMKKSKFRRR